jgi:cell wall-associated NlpC family hydrolase
MSGDRLDPRRHAYRDDLAADNLRGRVNAARFVAGELQRVARATVALRRAPDPALGFDTELVFGEAVQVYDTANGWAWCQAMQDGYVGYVPYEALALDVPRPTHRVSAIGTFLYGEADIKSPPIMHLSINAPLAVTETGERFYRLATGGYVIARHVSPLGKVARDFVDIAERMIGVPYLWGGRTRVGLDCSALVQVAMQAAGLACPRDSDMQEAELGANLLVPDELSGLRRGDLVFWKGHVGVMTDGIMLLHANAHHMAVVAEPLSTARQRIAKAGNAISSIKRPAAISADPIGRSA